MLDAHEPPSGVWPSIRVLRGDSSLSLERELVIHIDIDRPCNLI